MRAVFTIDDEVIQTSALADFDQLRPDVIGRHHSNNGLVGGESFFELFGGSQHEIKALVRAKR